MNDFEELYRNYRYHYSHKKPNRCCYCGRETIVQLVYEEPMGKTLFDNDNGFCVTVGSNYTTYYPTWRCLMCGQPYYQNKYDIDDSNIIYIYSNIFYAWIGGGEHTCFAIDKNNNKGFCTYHVKNKYKQFALEEEDVYTICKYEDDLLKYVVERPENQWYDVNVYGLNIYSGDKNNTVVVEDPYLSQHPLLKQIISIIEKYNHKIRLQEKSK